MSGRSETKLKRTPLRARIRKTTESAILAAAEEVFADQGLHSAHVGEIAVRAGVAVGTVYNHFKDRETLLAELVETRRVELLDELDRAIAGAARADFSVQLTAFLSAFFDCFRAHRKFFYILLQGELGSHESTYPTVAPKPSECMKEVYVRLEKLVKRGLREQALRPQSAEIYPAYLLGMLRTLVMRDFWLERKSGLPEVQEVLGFFMRGAGR